LRAETVVVPTTRAVRRVAPKCILIFFFSIEDEEICFDIDVREDKLLDCSSDAALLLFLIISRFSTSHNRNPPCLYIIVSKFPVHSAGDIVNVCEI
jgi:hypothetical protein